MTDANLDVARPDPDAAQRRAADPGASAWVAASAGTGKTKVLTDRFLNLLLAGTAPERVLCLTFTKAAAAEMATRIAGRLSRWAVIDEPALGEELQALTPGVVHRERIARARRLFAMVLDTPGGLRVQTIHAFCQSVLGRFPIETGLPPHFEVMDDQSSRERLIDVRDRVLLDARSGRDPALAAAVDRISDEVGEGRFDELLAGLLGQRPRLLDAVHGAGGPSGVSGMIRDRLRLAAGASEAGILRAACADDSFDGDGLRRAVAALLTGSKSDRERGQALADWLAAPDRRVLLIDSYRSAFLTAAGEPRKSLLTKAARAADPDAETVLATEAARMVALTDRLNAVATAERTEALVRVAWAVLDAYTADKRRAARVDYDDLVLLTRDLLADPEVAAWVLYKLDGGLDHVLIDEAQDTNPEQWQIVRALTEEFFAGDGATARDRTVFAVGDVKQSIYSFQRADPAGFLDGRAHFAARVPEAGRRWDAVDLDVSFRSTAAVLQAVDAVFARDPARDGVVEPGVADLLRHRPHRVGDGGLVELWPPTEPETAQPRLDWQPPLERRRADNPRRRLADAIAQTIADWIARGEILESEGRPIRPGDVMVLVRRRGSFVEDLLKALKDNAIDVAGADRLVLTEHLAVMDLVALGQALLLPEDDLTLAAVLKGPLVGLSEDALFDLAWNRGEARLWRELQARASERTDFADAHVFLAGMLARADNARPFELFAEMLAAGGRVRLTERLGPDASDPIDEFLAQALTYERAHVPSMQGFLHWLTSGRSEVKRDLEGETANKVRIMTVHGSKGLQAPIVFLPDTMSAPSQPAPVLWAESDGDAPLLPLWAPRQGSDDAVAAAARGRTAEARDREYRRLLYVAMTRAEDRLYVCGWAGTRATSAVTWHQMVSLGLDDIAERIDDPALAARLGTAQPALRLACPQIRVVTPEEPVAVAVSVEEDSLPPWAVRPPPDEPWPSRPLQPSRPSEDEPPVRSPLARGERARFRRGVILHALLQTLPDLPPARRRGAAERYLARPAHGLDPATRATWLEEVMSVLEAPTHRALFAPGSRAEVPVVGLVGEGAAAVAVSGQIDRLAVTDDAVLIVDFKTNRPPPRSVDRVPPLYLKQMAAYRDLVRRIYPGRRVSSGLLWTDGPSIMWLPDATLDEHAPGAPGAA